MDFVTHEQDCTVKTSMTFNEGVPVIQGKVYPLGWSENHVDFSVSQNLDIRSETGRIVMCPMISINFDQKPVYDYEVGSVMKAMEIARDRMDRYNALFNRFTNFDEFESALSLAISLNRYSDAAQYLAVSMFHTENAIDQTFQAIFQADSQALYPYQGSLWHQALETFVSAHPDFEGTLEAFVERKCDQLLF